jgi:hypothetical protein
MKLLPSPARARQTNDTVGNGIDVALTVALMLGIFMITMTVLAGVGFFAKFKYQYDARMDVHEAERVERANAGKVDGRDG